MNLPNKNGDEVLKHLRKSPCCWQAIVLIVSSSQTPRAKAAVRDLGVAAYFQKSSECASVMKLGPLMKQLLERSTSSGEVQ